MKLFRLIACSLSFCATVVAQTPSAPGTPTHSVAMAFDPVVSGGGPLIASDFAVADFNGDGILDIASTINDHLGITIRLGKGDGSFLPPSTYYPGYPYTGILAGDFNGDGKIDLAVAIPYFSVSGVYPCYLLNVLLGAGDGSFTAVRPYPAYYGLPLAVGDFNGDGKLDLVTLPGYCKGGEPSTEISLGNGDGTFRRGASLAITNFVAYPAVADFNGDGKLDVALPVGNSIDVFMGNGDGTFGAPAQYTAPHPNAGLAATAADFNGDGHLDIVTDGVQVLLNNGDGTFTFDDRVNFADAAFDFQGVVAGDFNGDGKMDFAAGNRNESYSSVIFLGNGDGTFQRITTEGGTVLQAGDFNGDGKLDLLTGLGIYLQTPAAVAPTVLDFGFVTVNSQSAPQTATLTNVWNTPMAIASLQITGTGASEFSETNNCSTTLAPGKSCQFQIVFAPTAQGIFSPSLSVTVPGAPASTVELVGIAD